MLPTGFATEVTGICLDSRQVQPGDLYVALPGTRAHGADFLAQAVSAGAVAVLTDAEGARRCGDQGGLPVVVVDDPRRVMAHVAVRIYGRPADSMMTFAITGTNGKTTTAHLVEAGLLAAGRHPGVIGTIGFRLDGAELPGVRTTVTTPESIDLQALFAAMAERGADAIAMEVSSHALDLHRVDGITFDVAGFTNLGRDHLDFHHTLENYRAAKAKLFTPERASQAVVDITTDGGRWIVDHAPLEVVTLGVNADGDYRASGESLPDGSMRIDLSCPDGRTFATTVPLPGQHNVHNAALAAAMLDLAGVDLTAALRGFNTLRIPGRMEQVALGEGSPTVYVDFAHTPQAVRAVGESFPNRRGRLIMVVGCGGDRDREKRAPMGEAAAATADLVIVTDDNPRSEDPALIRAQMLAGAPGAIDGGERRHAIARALSEAGPDDIITILGKGHEHGQEINGEIHPFDDVAVVTELWEQQ